MKITKVEATCHNIPVKLPLDKLLNEPVVFVRVETDEGITGFGITTDKLRFSTREFINRELAPFLVGKNPLETERIWNVDAYAEVGMPTGVLNASLVVGWGFSAIDIALWDIKGKYFNLPVFRLLGGARNPAPAYVTTQPCYSREELVEVVRKFKQMGQTSIKIQTTRKPVPNMAEEEAQVRAVREAMGDEGMLALDAGDQLDFMQARELLQRIEPYRIAWFEGPIFTNADCRLMAALRRVSSIPIAPGGSTPGRRWHYRELIMNEAVDLIMPSVANVGGYTEALKIANMAQAFNMRVNGGSYPHHNMHLVAGVANGWLVEFRLGHMLRDEIIFVNPPRLERNWITLPEKPGLGLEINEAALKEYREP